MNKMRLYIITMLLLISCKPKSYLMRKELTPQNLFFMLEVEMNQNMKKDGLIKIKIYNKSNKSLLLSSPKCWGNVSLTLKDVKGLSIPKIKIKPNPNCASEYLTIQPGEEKLVNFNYTLNQVFPNLRKDTYFLNATYHGKIKDLKNNVYTTSKPLVSNTLRIDL